jgi:uncharacterized membrane protein
MDGYLIVKFLHVSAAVLWLGGGIALLVLAILADRARQREAFMAVIADVGKLAPVVFMPGSVVVLLSGLAMIWLGGIAWDAWLVIGIAGIAVTAGLGALVLGPSAERITRLVQEPGLESEALAEGRHLLRIAKLDYVLQFTIVFAMVVKPGWTDAAILAGMAALVGLAAAMVLAWPGRAEAA